MSARLRRRAERRAGLIAQAEVQRDALARGVDRWRGPLALADRGIDALRSIGRHPGWVLGGVVLLAAVRPRRAGRWARWLWTAWQIGRRLAGR